MGGDEEALFGEAIYDYQNGGMVIGWWELFDEVHGDGLPWAGWD